MYVSSGREIRSRTPSRPAALRPLNAPPLKTSQPRVPGTHEARSSRESIIRVLPFAKKNPNESYHTYRLILSLNVEKKIASFLSIERDNKSMEKVSFHVLCSKAEKYFFFHSVLYAPILRFFPYLLYNPFRVRITVLMSSGS